MSSGFSTARGSPVRDSRDSTSPMSLGITFYRSEKTSLAPGISGCLMKVGDVFGILYSSRFASEGFKRFNVAHELGHYFLQIGKNQPRSGNFGLFDEGRGCLRDSLQLAVRQ